MLGVLNEDCPAAESGLDRVRVIEVDHGDCGLNLGKFEESLILVLKEKHVRHFSERHRQLKKGTGKGNRN